MTAIIRTLRRWFHGIMQRKNRKKSLCEEAKRSYGECMRNCMEPPFSYILCREGCIKGVAEEFDLSIKKVEKCLNE